ncbi:MAG TPA: acyl carrier protein [Candidatus Faecalibacterium avium]|uniref:acyl carrier protein n=1 Tax=unclassified Faecalibacterium TaxID=2646395 RepID=UPI000B3830D4|nr:MULTISPECIES: acyl carrier protein [unclassified Faecalibacterium]OUN75727.1 acyl carrier protein [Faecalibacterium sp. An58]OUQ38360.1 acyl carrier protein [Faecalibacterium sp. An121]HIV44281.1 acyl carrier protein [Candidatus Faecalibacterium avium]
MDFEKVKEIIVETLSCDADKVTPEATLAEDLEADSLSAVELSMALEEAFGISIADEDLPNLKTVGDLYQYLQDHADEAEKAE